MRFRPLAPDGCHWECDKLVADCGCLEWTREVFVAIEAAAALRSGAPIVDGEVTVWIKVAVEEVRDG